MNDFAQQDNASDIAVTWADKTHSFIKNEQVAMVPALTPPYAALMNVYGARIGLTSDGVGTKVEVAERMKRWSTLGFDLCAMVVDDLAAGGYEPVAITNVLDVNALDLAVVRELMSGLHEACRISGVAIAGGETAELGGRVGGYGDSMHANWCATALGVLRPGWEVIDGRSARAGDVIITLRSQGFRSNGFTLARRILEAAYGPDWHLQSFEGQAWGDLLLTPCDLYCPFVTALRTTGIEATGFAHITGGGLANKLGRTLRPNGLGATIHTPQPIPPAMAELARLGKVSAAQAYTNWNMGQGFCALVRAEDVDRTLAVAHAMSLSPLVSGAVTTYKELLVHSSLGVVKTELS